MAASRELSFAGLRFLERLEGFQGRMYCDAAGRCTIGFGHLVHRGGLGADPAAEAPFKHGISQQDAVTLLLKDINHAESVLEKFVYVPLTQPQYDALVSFVFNVGADAFEESTLLTLLNNQHYDAVPTELARWNRAGHTTSLGLTRRRIAEGKLFSEGVYA
jgi:lysozyme